MPTNKEKFNKRYGFAKDAPHSKAEITRLTGISKGILDDVYDRGIGAHRTNPGSVRNVKGVKGGGGKKMSPQAWAMGRVYSFVMGGPARKSDNDLWQKHKSKKTKK